jgi:2-dehydro-3-deoxyglucarate aldolase/4-hydroxy-2-oxoheptanedioate aldolase
MVFEFGTRGLPKILEAAEVDFVVVDTEHSGFGTADLANMMAWFKATPIAPFVRIPKIDHHFVSRTLDLGALGIMAPNVESADEARSVVDAAKYAPMGKRGVMLGAAHADFKNVKPRQFMDHSNENTTVICQIESQQGLDRLEEIAATPGVDVLWVGHFDLTLSMGIPGRFQDDRFLEALRLVVDTARKHGLAAGIQPRNLDQAREWLEVGFNVISCSGDGFVYRDALAQQVAGVHRLAGAR